MIRSLSKLISLFVLLILLSGANLHAQQILTGTLSADRTLSPEEFEYYIVNDHYIVPEGITLTILPGTRLKVMVDKSIRIAGGTLIASGTQEMPVVFEARDPDKKWWGISIENSTSEYDDDHQYIAGSIINNAVITGIKMQPALSIADTSVLLVNNVEIKNSDFIAISVNDSSVLVAEGLDISNCSQGLVTNNNSTILLSASTISYCSINAFSFAESSLMTAENININNCAYGIVLNSGSTISLSESIINSCDYGIYIIVSDSNVINNCTITNCAFAINFASSCISRYNLIENNQINNGLVGLFVPSNANFKYNRINANTLTYNNTAGLHIGNSGVADTGYNVISHNLVKYNTIGITQSMACDTLIHNIVENNYTGLSMLKASGNIVKNNVISQNYLTGVRLLEGSGSNTFEQNNVYDNSVGVQIDTSLCLNNTFRYNNITGNIQESFLIESGPQQTIEYNTITSLRDTASFLNRHAADVMAMNNNWGTTDTIMIDSIISDKNDYQKFGLVIYKPFLEAPHPESPISKPLNVIKKLIGNDVHVTWAGNDETDLAGYMVYYGDVESAVIINNGLNTGITIENIPLETLIRVTAYDVDADGINDRTEGHESAYSIALAGPFAGEDNAVCSGKTFSTVSATAIEYQSLNWTTLGDGTFSDASLLHTSYMPGFNDRENGSVNLILSITSLSGSMLTDTIQLRVLEYLVLEAGQDTTIREGSIFTINSATALNYTSLLWSTSGDGYFNKPDTLTTSYTPGANDIFNGWVKLTLTISSDCGTIDDNIILSVVPGYDISGTVMKDNAPVKGAIILAYNKVQDETRAVTSTTSNTEGKFTIPKISEGSYYIYAVPDPAIINTHIPTYYATRFNWQDAYLMKLNEDVYDVDINLNLMDVSLPEGQGSISGVFIYDGQPLEDFGIYNKQWFISTEGNPFMGEPGETYPASNHVVLLMNTDLTKIIGWTLSDLEGNFTFAGIPYGEYRLWGEKAGYTNKLSPIIYISPDNNSVSGVELSVDQQRKLIEAETDDIEPLISLIYPNPAFDKIRISSKWFEKLMSIELKIVDGRGKTVLHTSVNRSSMSSFGPVDISLLKRGIYLCQVSSENGTIKVMKLAIQ